LVPRYTTAEIASALKDTRGMVYVAAARLGCRGETIKARLQKSADLRRVLEEARGLMADKTEQKLFDAIEQGDAWAVQFYLRTQARNRGYVERQEVTPTDTEGRTLDLASLVLAAKQ
jgi:hypothetical protein